MDTADLRNPEVEKIVLNGQFLSPRNRYSLTQPLVQFVRLETM